MKFRQQRDNPFYRPELAPPFHMQWLNNRSELFQMRQGKIIVYEADFLHLVVDDGILDRLQIKGMVLIVLVMRAECASPVRA